MVSIPASYTSPPGLQFQESSLPLPALPLLRGLQERASRGSLELGARTVVRGMGAKPGLCALAVRVLGKGTVGISQTQKVQSPPSQGLTGGGPLVSCTGPSPVWSLLIDSMDFVKAMCPRSLFCPPSTKLAEVLV